MQIIEIQHVGSTNDYLLELATRNPSWEGVVTTSFQHSGKGMGTNTWESEDGKNLLFSILIHPLWLPIQKQYMLLMAEAISVSEVMDEYTEDITIKWPNDIYWKDKKISGTRIDANINGTHLTDFILGTGININQRVFTSDAPNPVSLYQITGREHNPKELLKKIITRFEVYVKMLRLGFHEEVFRLYHERLYRRKGFHPYADENGEFKATLERVTESGMLELRRNDGTLSKYMFKEVTFLQ